MYCSGEWWCTPQTFDNPLAASSGHFSLLSVFSRIVVLLEEYAEHVFCLPLMESKDISMKDVRCTAKKWKAKDDFRVYDK